MLEFFLKMILDFITTILKRCEKSYLFKLKRFLLGIKAEVIFVVEEDSWVIKWVGKYITEELRNFRLINAELTTPQIFKKKIIHFGSINCLITKDGLTNPHKSNKIVLSWFHINPIDERLKYIPIINKYVDLIHTSCKITANQLIKYGFDENKVIIIPLGVDLSHFKKYNDVTKNNLNLKEKYKIPKNKIIIGSFQKDGVGWGEGLEPKLIKGPDILCKVLKKLSEEFDIHVLFGYSRFL